MSHHTDTRHRWDHDTAGPITLLGVWAHPDDETYLSGLLMRRVALAGGRVVLVSATRGERGTDDESIPPCELAERRERELVVTFGPDGITRHDDHIAVGRWVTRAWHLVRAQSNGPWSGGSLRYAAMTETFVRRSEQLCPELPLTLVGSPASIPDEMVSLRVHATAEERRSKARALAAHESQVASIIDVVGADRFFDWWVDETFRTPTTGEIAEIAGV